MTIPRVAHLLAAALLWLPTGAGETTRVRGEWFADWRARLVSAAESFERGDDAHAVELYRSILDEAATRGEDGMLVARAADGLADLYRERRRFELAAPLYERSAAAWSRLFGQSQPRRAVTLHNLGICYVELADWAAAEKVLREALAVWNGNGRFAHRARDTNKVLDAALQRRGLP